MSSRNNYPTHCNYGKKEADRLFDGIGRATREHEAQSVGFDLALAQLQIMSNGTMKK
jgi:hypothetical protein